MYADAWPEEDDADDEWLEEDWLLRKWLLKDENWFLKEENRLLRDRVRDLEVESARRAQLAFDAAMTSDRMKLDLIMCGALSVPKKEG